MSQNIVDINIVTNSMLRSRYKCCAINFVLAIRLDSLKNITQYILETRKEEGSAGPAKCIISATSLA